MPKRKRDAKITEGKCKAVVAQFMAFSEGKDLEEAFRDEWVVSAGEWALRWLAFLGTASFKENKPSLAEACQVVLDATIQEMCGLTVPQRKRLMKEIVAQYSDQVDKIRSTQAEEEETEEEQE